MGIDKGNIKAKFISGGIKPTSNARLNNNQNAGDSPKKENKSPKFISDVKNYFAFSRKLSGQDRVTYDLDSLNDI